MKKLKLIAWLLSVSTITAFSQSTGTLKGQVFDAEGVESLPGAHVWIENGGKLLGTITDLDGFYTLKPIPPGNYNLHIKYTGYVEKIIENVKVSPDMITFLSKTCLTQSSFLLKGVEKVEYHISLIDKNGGTVIKVDSKELGQLANNRSLPDMISGLASSVFVNEGNKNVYFRGSRSGDAIYIVDGIKTYDSDLKIPGSMIGSLSIYNGGVPAKFGDFTGGVVVVESKGYFDWLVEKKLRDRYAKAYFAEKENEQTEEKEESIENIEKTTES